MDRKDYKIHIIGAGISGLLAAKTLENQGYRPTIIEATDRIGGRVKTDIVDGYQLDHGFQVLLDAYPMAKKHLDYDALELQKLIPGAVIFKDGSSNTIGDPLRDLSLLWSTMTASVGSFSDKLKILKLNVKLKGRSLETIFAAEERSTREYLQAEGFSERIISNFFKPFFAGIFLEPDLKTSSRMFEFVYKLFGEGMAVLPKAGISAITEQLKSQLNDTQFKFNTKVSAVNDEHILLDNNQKLQTHFTIIATEASSLLSNLNTKTQWKSCDNLYFTVKSKTIQKPIIGLVADADALINNLFYCNSVATKSKGAQELLSVTVVKKHELNEKDLIMKVQEDLKQFCDIEHSTFLKRYQILQALPDLEHLHYDCSPTETRIKPTIFLAGDQMLNGSLNAAMIAGERAAQGVILALEDGLRADGITSEYR